MAIQKEFYSIPLKAKRRIEGEKTARITKLGSIAFSYPVIRDLSGIEKGESIFMFLFCDVEKRALAFRFAKEFKGEAIKGGNVRLVKATINKHTNYCFYQIHVKNFFTALEDFNPPYQLEIKDYNDTLMGGKLNYIVVPKGNKEKVV